MQLCMIPVSAIDGTLYYFILVFFFGQFNLDIHTNKEICFYKFILVNVCNNSTTCTCILYLWSILVCCDDTFGLNIRNLLKINL